MGPGQLQVRARLPIPYGICFLYGGPLIFENKNSDGDGKALGEINAAVDTYTLALQEGVSCHGQNISRYINHRYNSCRYGNVEFMVIAVPQGINKFASVPAFLANTDIERGAPLLAWSYGNDYDHVLERSVVCDGLLLPFRCRSVLQGKHYEGDYRYAIGMGSIVWRPRGVGCANLHDLFVIVAIDSAQDLCLVTELEPCTSTAREPHLRRMRVPSPGERELSKCWIASTDSVALLLNGADYARCGEDAVVIDRDYFASCAVSDACLEPLICGALWDILAHPEERVRKKKHRVG
jgi:hypothetical protein